MEITKKEFLVLLSVKYFVPLTRLYNYAYVVMKLLKTILSWIYGAVIALRHRLYDWGIMRSYQFDIPVVCIGNITVGGTGKTPMAEMLIREIFSCTKIQLCVLNASQIGRAHV